MPTLVKVPERVVRRYAEKCNMQTIEAERDFDELCQFLEICAGTPERCAPSAAMDEVWHGFIDFTREYREFCINNFGRVIDHDPSSREENIEAYLRAREIAEQRFGDLNLRFWPVGADGATCCGAAPA